jgi:uncharacterized membrane protein YphA (DoxX/SURF4 family)
VKRDPRKYFQAAVYWASRLGLSGVFIYAAVPKITSPQDFADSIAAYHVLPHQVINLWALGLPFFELISGLLVLTGYYLRIGLLSIMSLLVIFLGAIAAALLRGLPIDCGCFGAESRLGSGLWVSICRDLVLLCGAVYAYRYYIRSNSVGAPVAEE